MSTESTWGNPECQLSSANKNTHTHQRQVLSGVNLVRRAERKYNNKHLMRDMRCNVTQLPYANTNFVLCVSVWRCCCHTSCCHRHNNCDNRTGGRTDELNGSYLSSFLSVFALLVFTISREHGVTYGPAPRLQLNTSIMVGERDFTYSHRTV